MRAHPKEYFDDIIPQPHRENEKSKVQLAQSLVTIIARLAGATRCLPLLHMAVHAFETAIMCLE